MTFFTVLYIIFTRSYFRMTVEQNKNRTPDYDPRKNSSFINFLLRSGIDGGYQKDVLPCSEAEDSLFSNEISLGQFPLFPEKYRKIASFVSVLFALLTIGAVLLAICRFLVLQIITESIV